MDASRTEGTQTCPECGAPDRVTDGTIEWMIGELERRDRKQGARHDRDHSHTAYIAAENALRWVLGERDNVLDNLEGVG